MSLSIGFFDSGAGGLTVLGACRRALPAPRYLYFGDNLRAPYGSRPPEEIYAFTREGVLALRKKGADAVVLACNTATAVCAARLRDEFPFPILGVEPAVLPAAKAGKRVLVLCTPRTAESDRLKRLLARCPDNDFCVFPAAGLAAAIERMLRGEGEVRLEEHLPRGAFDAVVLGCTHYAFLRREISAFCNAPVFDGSEGVARRLCSLFPACEKWSEETKKNKSLPSLWNERDVSNKSLQRFWRGKGAGKVIFLSRTGAFNRKIYKQTFKNPAFEG